MDNEDKIKILRLTIDEEQLTESRLSKEVMDWTLSETQFLAKKRALNGSRAELRKLYTQLEKLDQFFA